jgi:copper transport protein
VVDWMVAVEASPKVAVYLALLFATGVCAARWLIRTLRARRPPDGLHSIERVLGSLLLVAAVALVAAHVARAWAHTVAAFGLSEALVWEPLRLMAWESQWGSAWRVQTLCSLALVVASVLARRGSASGWFVATALTIACCYTLPLVGHAEGEPARIVLHGSHVLGAGVWLGALAALRFGHRGTPSLEHTLAHFAPLALTGALTIGSTGALAAFVYVGAPSQLWTQSYGRTLLLKVATVVGVALCGLANWRRYRASDAGRDRRPRSSRTVTVELWLAVLVIALTAVLTELPHP